MSSDQAWPSQPGVSRPCPRPARPARCVPAMSTSGPASQVSLGHVRPGQPCVAQKSMYGRDQTRCGRACQACQKTMPVPDKHVWPRSDHVCPGSTMSGQHLGRWEWVPIRTGQIRLGVSNFSSRPGVCLAWRGSFVFNYWPVPWRGNNKFAARVIILVCRRQR